MDNIEVTDEIYIFGAQSRARTLSGYLSEIYPNVRIKAYLVDALKGNSKSIEDVPVVCISDNVKFDMQCTVFIATKGIYHAKIEADLRKKGFSMIVPISVEVDNFFRNLYVESVFERQKRSFIKLEELYEDYNKTHNLFKIYVAKSIYDKPLEEEYIFPDYEIPIQVGATLTEERMYNPEGGPMLTDDVGDNISNRNRQYSELTALYWMWKHATEDVIGLAHYRRHFILPENWMDIMQQENIDIILPVPTCVLPSISENYRERHDASDWDYLLKYLSENSLDYFAKGKGVFDEKLYLPCNMFIAKKEVLDILCEWMFPILDAVVSNGGIKEDVYQNRYAGFISERLITLFFYVHQHDYKIVYADRIFLR